MVSFSKFLLSIPVLLLSIAAYSQPGDNGNGTANAAASPYRLEKITEGLTSPVDLSHAGDGSGRVFVVEQPGRIMILKNGKLQPQPFLDIKSRLVKLDEGYSEIDRKSVV